MDPPMPRVRLPVSFALLLLGCGDEGSAPADGSTGSTTAEPASSSTGASATEAPAADGSSSASDSTGPASVCGNGLVEVEEECDDRNVVDGDACYSNCTVPFEVLWTATYDGGGDDDAVAARFDAEGNLYVLGTTDVVGQGSDLWLHRYGPDGREGATWTYDGAQHGDDRANAMTWVDGDLVIVGSELTAIGRDSLVIRLSVDSLAAVWIQRFDGPGTGTSGDDYAVGVTVDPAGDLLVASTEGTDTEGADMALRKLDPDGNVLWIDHYDDPLFHQLDLATAVVVGVIVSALTTRYRDLTVLVAFSVQLFMYASPIIYPLSALPEGWRFWAALNPIAPIIETFRYAYLGAGAASPMLLAYSAVVIFVVLVVGVAMFNRVERTFMDTV